jgi:hypothetical protein
MTCFRRRRLRSRIAWLALLGLLWTQVTLAGHGLCVLDALGHDLVPAAAAASKHDCHDSTIASEAPNAEALVCAAHCSQGDQSSENARVPLLAALPVTRWLPPALTTLGDALPARTLRDPRGQHHRPTAHPATLLLI